MDWPGHKSKCMRKPGPGKETSQKRTTTEIKTLNEIKGIPVDTSVLGNSRRAANTDIPENTHSKYFKPPETFQLDSEMDLNIEAKMKAEYSNHGNNVTDHLKRSVIENEKVQKAGEVTQDSSGLEERTGKRESATDEKDLNDEERSTRETEKIESIGEQSQGAGANSEGGPRSESASGIKDGISSESKQVDKEEDKNGPETHLCRYCGKQGFFQKCSRCKETFYCSRECQREDWRTHKVACTKKMSEEEKRKRTLHKKMTKDNE